jgi:hypothetical protein
MHDRLFFNNSNWQLVEIVPLSDNGSEKVDESSTPFKNGYQM